VFTVLYEPNPFNPWIREQKNFIILRNWVNVVPIFLKLISQLFFIVRLVGSVEVKTLLLFRFLIFHAVV